MKSLLLTLLLSVSAFAQPVVGPEVTSAPLSNLDDYAIAPQREGFVFAWTANGRLFAGHLDATLHITAPPLEVPLYNPTTTASLPAIASNGTSVFVAWHERPFALGETAYMALLSADAKTLVRGPQQLNITKDGPLARSVNGNYVLYTGDLRYVYDENLDTLDGVFISRNLGAALSEDGTVATASERGDPFSCNRVCFFGCTAPPQPCTVSATVTFRFGAAVDSTSYTFIIPPNSQSQDPFLASPPSVGPNGDWYIGLVRLPTRTDVFIPAPLRQITLPVIVSGQAALAGNGGDVLLVWTNPRVTGIVIHADGTASEPFPIAAAGFQPKVVSIDSNDFAVLYRTDFNQQSALIQGRIVHLQAPKRRGIR